MAFAILSPQGGKYVESSVTSCRVVR